MSLHCEMCGHRSNEVKTGGKLNISRAEMITDIEYSSKFDGVLVNSYVIHRPFIVKTASFCVNTLSKSFTNFMFYSFIGNTCFLCIKLYNEYLLPSFPNKYRHNE